MPRRRAAQPARPGQADPPRCASADRRADLDERLQHARASIRAAPTSSSPASVLLDTILRRLGAEDLTLCDLALREGLVLDYIHRNTASEIAQVERYPDVRRRSVVELGERCSYWPEHAQQVARLALSLFDQTRGVHGLDRPRARVARIRARCCTTSACTSATSGITGTRTT